MRVEDGLTRGRPQGGLTTMRNACPSHCVLRLLGLLSSVNDMSVLCLSNTGNLDVFLTTVGMPETGGALFYPESNQMCDKQVLKLLMSVASELTL